jgi:protein gp37
MKKSEMIETGQWWTDSLNVSIGCTKISPACDGCYAEKAAARLAEIENARFEEIMQYAPPGESTFGRIYSDGIIRNGCWTGKIKLLPERLERPLHWRNPRIIFVDSMSDLFHKDVPFEFIDKVMATIALCPQHTFLVLTKRIERASEYFDGLNQDVQYRNEVFGLDAITADEDWPSKNLWLGCTPAFGVTGHPPAPHTVPDNSRTDTKPEDIATLLQIPAAKHFVSLEPMLREWALDSLTGYHSCIDSLRGNRSESDADGNITTDKCEKLDWVVVGAETGPKARYCPIEWIEDVVEQCKAAGVPVWVKAIHTGTADKFKQVHKFAELPESVRVRQSPFIK